MLLNCNNNKNNVIVKLGSKNDNKFIKERKSGLEMVFVKGGEFTMGGYDDVDDGGNNAIRIADECPHIVIVNDFFIGKYEVTQADWKAVMGALPSGNTDCDDCPVSQVSWDDIQEFIKALNLKYLEHYRLPTEEEWEFASKGGVDGKDYRYSGSHNAEEVAWFSMNSKGKTHPVGLLKPNELGIYDMSGNIWEWCSNFKTPYPCDSLGKPFNTKVLRGGSFNHRQESVRVIDRNARQTSMRLQTLGFRLAK